MHLYHKNEKKMSLIKQVTKMFNNWVQEKEKLTHDHI